MRVLVVEDEKELLRVVAQALREAGYAVDEASDGMAGLAKAKHWDYDAILLDVMLPALDGWDALRQIRVRKKTPVMLLTARDSVADRVRGLDLGADDYLVKPFDLTELLARLRALIRRASGQADPLLRIGSIVIDTRGKTVTRDGEAVVLTAREYALVECLALRQGEVVAKTTLYEHLFDEHDDSMSNLLEVHVSNVRKKLGKDFVATRRGQGYVIL